MARSFSPPEMITPPSPPPIPRRPAIVTWLAVVVFLLAGLNLFAAINGLLGWQFLGSLAITLPPWALLLPRGVWAAAWLVIGWGLLRLKPWARISTPAALLLYQLTFAGQQLIYASQEYTRARLPFALILALVSTALATWIISRPGVRSAFVRRAFVRGAFMRATFNRDTMTPDIDPGEPHEPPDN